MDNWKGVMASMWVTEKEFGQAHNRIREMTTILNSISGSIETRTKSSVCVRCQLFVEMMFKTLRYRHTNTSSAPTQVFISFFSFRFERLKFYDEKRGERKKNWNSSNKKKSNIYWVLHLIPKSRMGFASILGE